MTATFHRELLDRATQPYKAAGRFAWHFSRSKLRRDPVFFGLLEHGVIEDAQRLVDLGCGQGLLASWLQSAKALYDAGNWPPDWPAPPRLGKIFGLELMPKDVARARKALSGCAEFEVGDMRTHDFGTAEIIAILDALHYIDYGEQLEVLRRVRMALPPEGLLVTRVGNLEGGLPFAVSQWVDRAVSFSRGHRLSRLYCRSITDWMQLLRQLGFSVKALPMCRGTPFANVLLVARVHGPAVPRPPKSGIDMLEWTSTSAGAVPQ